MNINELATSLKYRAVALEVITWLRDNELLADNSGNACPRYQISRTICLLRTGRKRDISSNIQNISRGQKMTLTFGQAIRTARVSIGYSQRELAKLVEVDFTYLSKLESDRSDYPPKEYVVQQLAHYLGLDHEELMCLTGRLPERYQEFLKQNYKVMPALFQWMRQNPEFILKSLERETAPSGNSVEGNPRTSDFLLPQIFAAQKLFEEC